MENIIKLTKELKDLLKEAQTSKKDDQFKKLIVFMNTEVMRNIIEKLLEFSKDISNEEIDLLKVILEISITIYNYSGEETGMSDSEYDSLLEYYKEITGEDDFVSEPIVSGEDIVHHRYKTLRGTLDKVYKLTDEDVLKNKSQKSIEDWIKTTEKAYKDATGESIDLLECDVLVMPKFDGVSCVFECNKDGSLQRALTRGDTSRNEAQDITHIFKDVFKGHITDSPYEYGLKTEIMMLDGDLIRFNEEFGKDYKNTRSIVSSILNSDERDVRAEYLQIIQLRYSEMIDGVEGKQKLPPGVYDYPYLECKLGEFDKIREFSISHKTVSPGLRCDGSVIYLKDPKLQQILGRSNEKQKFEFAFKFTEEVEYSEVKDIVFTAGLFGRMNPVVIFKPVKMKGNTIEKASLGSLARFNSLKLAKGDIIKVIYDIIPYVDFNEKDRKCIRSSNDPIECPDKCPDCGSKLEATDNEGILYCKNPKCPCRMKGKILNFTNKMNIGEISYATVNDFYDAGLLETIQDLYLLKDHKNSLVQLPGYGETKINKILQEIEDHKSVIPSVMLGSIGIEGLSIKSFKNILSYVSMEEMIEIALMGNIAFFTVLPGIKDITAKKLVDGIRNNLALLIFLQENLNILEEPKFVKGDFTVVFTKVRNTEIEEFIKENHGSIGDNVTKETSLVVVPKIGVKSSKVNTAMKYEIPIVSIDECKEYIINNLIK